MVTLVVLTDETRPPDMVAVEDVVEVTYVTEDELPKALPGAEILFVWHFLSHAVPAAWPAVGAPRWVHVASAGVERFLFPDLVTSDTVVTNSRGVFDEPMAEYVLGLVLAFAKDLAGTVRLQTAKRWQHRETERVGGSRALVVGTGPIGRAIARKLTAAGLVVGGVGRTGRDADPDLGRVRPMADLAGALAEADYVVLAAPATDQTRGMLDAGALAAMKPTARLINVGRGSLVVQEDLIAALRAGRIAGAALDVFDDEPLPPESPLWELPGVLVSPHMSGDVVGWRNELSALFVDNFTRYRSGRPLRNVVDKQLGYVR
jgi:phosphoglycerate dehydrogenase-like enzyme